MADCLFWCRSDEKLFVSTAQVESHVTRKKIERDPSDWPGPGRQRSGSAFWGSSSAAVASLCYLRLQEASQMFPCLFGCRPCGKICEEHHLLLIPQHLGLPHDDGSQPGQVWPAARPQTNPDGLHYPRLSLSERRVSGHSPPENRGRIINPSSTWSS